MVLCVSLAGLHCPFYNVELCQEEKKMGFLRGILRWVGQCLIRFSAIDDDNNNGDGDGDGNDDDDVRDDED